MANFKKPAPGRLAAGAWACAVLLALALPGCVGSNSNGNSNSGDKRRSDQYRSHPLDSLPTATIQYQDKTIRVWVANTESTRTEGLMHVPASEIADDQGMLFVFEEESLRGFWMKDTITSLDIAFARADGTIVKTHQMPPLTLSNFPSIEPAQFALEMKAGAFARYGIVAGGKLVIPQEIADSGR